ncbi:unnamed protein product [Phytophthora fragariaefolia]|uniref:Unnamed protein product n=1 Tax=Phytophthora fragariaefolia TaxID=1490495 RepID=A0A9W6YGR9_9STRA|nr:unnamed protein product [Phytophthora fragariaefolia]GMF80831.1 unnamed protein product [Phytophthora fragariaefolia]
MPAIQRKPDVVFQYQNVVATLKMPNVAAKCVFVPSAWRLCGVEISLRNVLTTAMATPFATPDTKRPAENHVGLLATTWITEPSTMMMALKRSVVRRPHLLDGNPDSRLPNMPPTIHALTSRVHVVLVWPGNMRHVPSSTGRALQASVLLKVLRLTCELDHP